VDKTRAKRLRWFNHVMWRGDMEVVRVAMEMNVEDKRERKTE